MRGRLPKARTRRPPVILTKIGVLLIAATCVHASVHNTTISRCVRVPDRSLQTFVEQALPSPSLDAAKTDAAKTGRCGLMSGSVA
jgi:hypothetical protein